MFIVRFQTSAPGVLKRDGEIVYFKTRWAAQQQADVLNLATRVVGYTYWVDYTWWFDKEGS